MKGWALSEGNITTPQIYQGLVDITDATSAFTNVLVSLPLSFVSLNQLQITKRALVLK